MKQINCYLMFDGNCHKAMTFYGAALGAEPEFMKFADMPNCPDGAGDRVMHARIINGEATLMASDTMVGRTPVMGDSFSVAIATESKEETDRIFAALSEGATVEMPLQDMFWGAYFGMLRDKFGINWMLNFDKPKA
jgi:PhnB protein